MKDIEIPLAVARPAMRAFNGSGYYTLNQLSQVDERDLLKLHGVGPKAIRILKQAFDEHGTDAAMSKTPPKR